MNILVLGGTVFLGRHFVEAARQANHTVTLFHRGQHNPELFPDVTRILGNRDGDLQRLHGSSWDVVVDTSGYLPRIVRSSAEALASVCRHYLFVSSISVYADLSQPGATEDAPVGTLVDESTEEITGETYGPLKALCEREVLRVFGDRSLIIRPGLIVGPHDPTDRYTYWPYRIAKGGDVLVPGTPAQHVQFIDVRDLASWMLHLLERQVSGVFHATGPEEPLSMKAFLDTCRLVSTSDARLVWVDEQFLLDAGVAPWSELPLWVPALDPSTHGFNDVDCSRAFNHDLRCRPIADTARDTLDWALTRAEDHSWRAGINAEREAELLQAWRTHQP